MSIIKFTIPVPCHENWQHMTPNEQGRFCSSCKKDVTDFTGMRDDEVYGVLLNADTNMCGRFSNDQVAKGINTAPIKKKVLA